MKTNEVNDNLIGKRCKCLFLGKMVTGKIIRIKTNKYCVQVLVSFDTPQYFDRGSDRERYIKEWVIGWFSGFDNGGNLRFLELINSNNVNIQHKKVVNKKEHICNKKDVENNERGFLNFFKSKNKK